MTITGIRVTLNNNNNSGNTKATDNKNGHIETNHESSNKNQGSNTITIRA